MRKLLDRELALVAGGQEPLVQPTVTVTGTNYSNYGVYFSPTGGNIAYQGGAGIFGDSEEDPDEPDEWDNDRHFPTNVDENEIRSYALAAAAELRDIRISDGIEAAMFFVTNALGDIVDVIFVTSGNSDNILPADITAAINDSDYASGLQFGTHEISAWVHTQSDPLPSTSANNIGGGSDWGFVDSLISSGVADERIVTYIAADNGNVYEYTYKDKDTSTVGERIDDDN